MKCISMAIASLCGLASTASAQRSSEEIGNAARRASSHSSPGHIGGSDDGAAAGVILR